MMYQIIVHEDMGDGVVSSNLLNGAKFNDARQAAHALSYLVDTRTKYDYEAQPEVLINVIVEDNSLRSVVTGYIISNKHNDSILKVYKVVKHG